MDAAERNDLRLRALAPVDPGLRRELKLGRLLEVDGDTPETATYFINCNVNQGRGVPWPALGIEALTALPLGLRVGDAFGGIGVSEPKLVREFLGRPELAKVTALDFAGANMKAASKAFAKANQLGALTWLDLSSNSLDLPSLLACKSLGRLRHLNLRGNKLGDEDFRAVVKSSTLASLTSLEFSANDIADGIDDVFLNPEIARFEGLGLSPRKNRSWAALTRSPHLAGLRALDLGHSPIDGSGAQLLAHPGFPHLEELSLLLMGDELEIALPALKRLTVYIDSPRALEALAASPALGRLEHLALSVSQSALDAVPALYASGGFRTLTSLALRFTASPPSREQELALSRLPAFERLRHLNFEAVTVNEETIAEMLKNRPFRHLERLVLPGDVNPGGARLLAEHADLAGLKELRFLAAKIGDRGTVAIARSPYLKNLQVLDLSDYVGDEGARALGESDNFQQLIELYVGAGHTDEGRAALMAHQKMPKIWILAVTGKLGDPEIRG